MYNNCVKAELARNEVLDLATRLWEGGVNGIGSVEHVLRVVEEFCLNVYTCVEMPREEGCRRIDHLGFLFDRKAERNKKEIFSYRGPVEKGTGTFSSVGNDILYLVGGSSCTVRSMTSIIEWSMIELYLYVGLTCEEVSCRLGKHKEMFLNLADARSKINPEVSAA